jgi:hypothetical protein
MRLVLVTGMSGAGKSVVIRLLEDTGYMARVAYLMDRVMRSVGLNAQSSCLAAGVPALVFNAESADLVLESLRAFDGVGVSTLPFSCLILAYEGLVFDSAASTALGLAVQKNRISRIVYDEG